jgi:hypothetical protein
MPLTAREVIKLWERRKAGEPTKDLCKETGICQSQLLRYWRDRGFKAAELPHRTDPEKLRWDRNAYTLHYIEEKTWEQVAQIMGWKGTIKALVSRIQWYSETQKMPIKWKGGAEESQKQRVSKRTRKQT